MDIILRVADSAFFTPYVYPTSWAEDDISRQLISLFLITIVGGYLLYIIPTTLNYMFIFDKNLMKHPQFLQVNILIEIDRDT